jgi:flagellar assembly protein FliH
MTSLFEFVDLNESACGIPVELVERAGRMVTPLNFSVLPDRNSTLGSPASVGDVEEATSRTVDERMRQMQVMLDVARAEAADETRNEMEASMQMTMRQEYLRIEQVCREFAQDRHRYFAAAEIQVVTLALAIARRILARDVEHNSMHLACIVRAALTRVHDGSLSVLRVPMGETEIWQGVLAEVRDGSLSVVGDARMAAGECVLETEIGRVELGVQVQLQQVERGFNDLLHRRGE